MFFKWFLETVIYRGNKHVLIRALISSSVTNENEANGRFYIFILFPLRQKIISPRAQLLEQVVKQVCQLLKQVFQFKFQVRTFSHDVLAMGSYWREHAVVFSWLTRCWQVGGDLYVRRICPAFDEASEGHSGTSSLFHTLTMLLRKH